MKKNRLLFLLPLLAAFALTSCDQLLSNFNFNGPRKRSSHEDSEVLDDSEDYFNSSSSSKSSSKSSSTGRSSSSRSSSSRSSSSSGHQHTWGEWSIVVEPTCTEEGMQQRECSICHQTQNRSVNPIGHDWGKWKTIVSATCQNEGIQRHTCNRCGAQEDAAIPLTNHDFGYDSDITWQVQPTCEKAGVGIARCKYCGIETIVNIPAYGHDMFLIDYHDPVSGRADTRIYKCNRCGLTYFGLRATDVSLSSASHLVNEVESSSNETGMRFWGRPIGNDVELNSNGEASQSSHEPVFNSQQTGDFFEFVFDLSAEQAALFSTCKLYCDAKPAQYMGANGLDFWAAKTGVTDWTPGYYIDDNPDTEENEVGQLVTDYRYVLYVDGVLQSFDSSMASPVPRGDPRAEYVMPYTFHLHAGTNSFRLHMAGGYRSTFYSFVFRPDEEEQQTHVHTWGEEEVVTPPTCTENGRGHRQCTICGEDGYFAIVPLGHSYEQENGVDKVTWTKRANCTESGVGTKRCTRCNSTVEVTEAPLGHDVVIVGDDTEPEAGKAKVRMYACRREGCGMTMFGFKATEVSEASQPHLVDEIDSETGEVGKRFWGRPIGNDVELDENGVVDSNSHEPVFNASQTGDYFEFVFDLTANQVNALGEECVLYCDATPAPYMYQNNLDFWARRPGDEDWTPGYYIDDNPDTEENEIGQQIVDYRYALYVDGVLRTFDPTMEATVLKNNARSEYILPYVFHLHAGTNSFRLHMAGGYRSLFHNFIFRPYVAPTPITVNTDVLSLNEGDTFQLLSPFEELTYKSNNTKVATVSETGLVTAVAPGTATISVSKEGNYRKCLIPVTVTQVEGTFTIQAETGFIAPEDGAEWYYSSWGSGSRLRNFKKDSTVTFTFDSSVVGLFKIIFNARGSNVTLSEHITVKVNDVEIVVNGYYNNANSGIDVVVGQANLKASDNTLVITTISTNSPFQLHYIKLVPIV